MRSWVVIALAAVVCAAGCGGGVLKNGGGVLKTQYEYEEELYLALDGSAGAPRPPGKRLIERASEAGGAGRLG